MSNYREFCSLVWLALAFSVFLQLCLCLLTLVFSWPPDVCNSFTITFSFTPFSLLFIWCPGLTHTIKDTSLTQKSGEDFKGFLRVFPFSVLVDLSWDYWVEKHAGRKMVKSVFCRADEWVLNCKGMSSWFGFPVIGQWSPGLRSSYGFPASSFLAAM